MVDPGIEAGQGFAIDHDEWVVIRSSGNLLPELLHLLRGELREMREDSGDSGFVIGVVVRDGVGRPGGTRSTGKVRTAGAQDMAELLPFACITERTVPASRGSRSFNRLLRDEIGLR